MNIKNIIAFSICLMFSMNNRGMLLVARALSSFLPKGDKKKKKKSPEEALAAGCELVSQKKKKSYASIEKAIYDLCRHIENPKEQKIPGEVCSTVFIGKEKEDLIAYLLGSLQAVASSKANVLVDEEFRKVEKKFHGRPPQDKTDALKEMLKSKSDLIKFPAEEVRLEDRLYVQYGVNVFRQLFIETYKDEFEAGYKKFCEVFPGMLLKGDLNFYEDQIMVHVKEALNNVTNYQNL
jgi:hypothetical protein